MQAPRRLLRGAMGDSGGTRPPPAHPRGGAVWCAQDAARPRRTLRDCPGCRCRCRRGRRPTEARMRVSRRWWRPLRGSPRYGSRRPAVGLPAFPACGDPRSSRCLAEPFVCLPDGGRSALRRPSRLARGRSRRRSGAAGDDLGRARCARTPAAAGQRDAALGLGQHDRVRAGDSEGAFRVVARTRPGVGRRGRRRHLQGTGPAA
jgi:hypothetical protein